MLERKGSVLRRCITEVTVLAQVQLSGCLLCLLGRNQGCCGCRAGQVVEYVVRVGRFEDSKTNVAWLPPSAMASLRVLRAQM